MNDFTVVKGDGIGKKFLVPTLNLEPAQLSQEFVFGVYACNVILQGDLKRYKGALFYGEKNVLGLKKLCLEVNLLDFEGNLYGEKVQIEMGDLIRGVKKFDKIEDLKRQIEKDLEERSRLK